MHAQQVAQGNSQCGAQKKLPVGEPELESEQERERHTYADDSAQSYHQYILTHEGCGSHHVGQCPEIYSAAELEYYREEYINPRTDTFRNKDTTKKWNTEE